MKGVGLNVEEFLHGKPLSLLNMSEVGLWLSLVLVGAEGIIPGIIEIRPGIAWSRNKLAEYLRCEEIKLNNLLNKLVEHGEIELLNNGSIKLLNKFNVYRYLGFKNTSFKRLSLNVLKNKTPYSPPFLNFWNEYPRKQSKYIAWQSWLKINPDSDLVQQIMESISKCKETTQWRKDGGQFIPMPATWLNQRRWEDGPFMPDKSW